MRDIASHAGVSIATVSRVLNDQEHVSPGTRELVQQAIDELGGRGPRRRPARTGAVFVRCPYLLTDYFGLIVSSIAETLDLHGRQLVLNAGEAAQHTSVLPTLANRPGIGGAIVVLPPEPGEELVALQESGFPFVIVDPRENVPRDIAAVSASHFAGARSLTAHLTELGHRRIGLLAGPENWLAGNARRAGHIAALAEAGTLLDPRLVVAGQPTVRFGFEAALHLLSAEERPTALLGFNDKVASGALAAAAQLGLRVPEDLSIAGFDDIDLAEATRPALTTVRQPLGEMGRIAVGLLIRLLERHRLDALHVELATDLIIRESTGPVGH
ncbi:LacI family DNA-binding transcriptional regulator [Paractinoplanes bogorensis]|uniref:LacI family DNA-binding transcriptional regulator n=1 Tax=Paractinoplanes bogorensis TaxID=1610840 RepID=UPI0027DFF97A|nr:LacI family DNA-binding transcriptional regulator [Actinoplanes bogorensis]